MSEEAPYLSIIIPVHNEERRVKRYFGEVVEYVNASPYDVEIVVVDNGSSDGTEVEVRRYMDAVPCLRLIKEEKRGKGLAVRRGMLEAKGQYRFMCDVDLSMPLSELHRFLPPESDDVDIVIGNRLDRNSEVTSPPHRNFIRQCFNGILRLMVLPGISDSMCGFKCLKGEVAEDLFSRMVMEGISFDVELLYLALRRDYSIKETAIRWSHDDDSRISLFSDSLKTFLDVLAIRRRHKGVRPG